MIYFLMVLNAILLVTGQILWKIAVSKHESLSAGTMVKVILSPLFIGGGLLYVIATGLWLYILSVMPLSIAYPFQSISYVLGAMAAYLLFKETITKRQITGFLVIIFGVYLIAS
ncbi:EamA family transporter [Jeotgalibacillus aurantiacus]|uniref:EamA family transporter n=1 Tax=Jeotgalibacillus aurantiacus TaxID=2763266 RepID=UPI001D0A1576|nr:EamA family transporter [Jeotgalibacillus aurantiacus]